METLWDYIKNIYKEKYNIPPEVIDYISVQPILKRCVTGYGNKTISYATGESVDYISQVIFQFLGFPGWSNDLDLNPLAIYNKNKGNYEYFKQDITMLSPYEYNSYSFTDYSDDGIIRYAYNICEKYIFIDNKIKEIYEKAK